ncbi:MAG: ankyrin repeat domain-containing protein [Akkermansia sp.]|nr:ankyrin repeat domain-containing protein [Akkermansia sp.]MDO4752030.1 ankyrin repeat domain-containing protein [Akkermansia sp.]
MKHSFFTTSALSVLMAFGFTSCNNEGNNLNTAVAAADVEAVKDIISAGTDLNAREATLDGTPLHVVATADAAKMAKEAGNEDDAEEIAKITGQLTEIAKLLIESGADASLVDKNGETALFPAARLGHTEVAKVFINSQKMDLNARAKNSATAILPAAWHGHTEVVKALIAAGANINAADANGNTALIFAARKGHLNIVNALIAARVNTELPDIAGKTALTYAAQEGKNEVITALTAAGAGLNTQDIDGNTALMCAAIANQNAAVQLLIDAKADLNLKNKNGYSAITAAAWAGNTEAVKALLTAGATITANEIEGFTLLMNARGNSLYLPTLKAAGVDLNMKNAEGKSALQLATEKGHSAVAEALKAAGATE